MNLRFFTFLIGIFFVVQALAASPEVTITLDKDMKVFVPHGKKRGYLAAEEHTLTLPKGTVIQVPGKNLNNPTGFKSLGSKKMALYVRGFNVISLPADNLKALSEEEISSINAKNYYYMSHKELKSAKEAKKEVAPAAKLASPIPAPSPTSVPASNSLNNLDSALVKLLEINRTQSDGLNYCQAVDQPILPARNPAATSLSAAGGSSDEINPACRFLASHPDGALKVKNCQKAFELIPNQKALSWALDYMEKNLNGIKDPSCFMNGLPLEEKGREEWKSLAEDRGITLENLKQDIVKRGIENSCQFLLNDFSKTCEGDGGQNGYWVDLCGDSEKVVRQLNRLKAGTGTCKNDFLDKSGKKSTVLGAFVTGKSADFYPYKMSKGYRALEKAGKLRSLSIFGLHDSNNHTFWDKPVHTSPYATSWGCPAIDGEDADLIEKMGESQTLLVNYGPDKFHESGDSCQNESWRK